MYLMNRNKSNYTAALILAAAIALTGCSNSGNANSETGAAGAADGSVDSFTVVCTTFSQYDWVKNIMGEKADESEIIYLLDKGVDMHSYQASASDIRTILSCDLFLYNGGESDNWAADIASQNPDLYSLSAMSSCQAVEEEIVEGMETEEKDGKETEYDEHIWLSLENAQLICRGICEALCELDEDNAEIYRENTESYCKSLGECSDSFEQLASSVSNPTILVADRFPFRYLFDDYGIEYYAAFPGCSADSEASFETIAFLSSKTDELSLSTILVTKSSDMAIAKTIIENTKEKNQTIAVLNSMQAVTAADIESGASYIGMMNENLAVLTAALKG